MMIYLYLISELLFLYSTPVFRSGDGNEATDHSTFATNNVTVIEVSSASGSHMFSFNDFNNALNNVERTQTDVSTVSLMPINSSFVSAPVSRTPVHTQREEESSSENGNHRFTYSTLFYDSFH